jgi:YegS/Rv2252/BmrU family lipid kinase
MDLGRINGRYFLNIAGVGLDAEVAAEAMRNFKGFPGSLAYLLALLKQLVVYRPCPVNITLDGRELHEVAWLIAVANARYFGGGMKVAPQADPWDGLADVVIVSGVSRLRFLSIFPRVYSGSHLLNDCVRVIRARAIRIDAKGQLAVQADGEPAGTTPFEIIMERQAVLFKVPRNKTTFYRPE